MHLDDLTTPALILDIHKLDGNLSWMARRAADLQVALRPHVKTHKCIEIGKRQRDLGARGITVSTLYEAGVFADHGFDDITWAFPFIPSSLPQALELTERIRLHVVVDSESTLNLLEESGAPFSVWIKVDSGYHRAGIDPTGPLATTLARRITEARALEFGGILSHSGHAYNVRGGAVADVAEEERSVMSELADRLRGEGMTVPDVSVGSTPSMRLVHDLTGVTEARPGNYALFDYSQVAIGSCTPADCAVTVLTTVVSSQPGAGHCIVDAGALALSKDTGPSSGTPTMGETFADYDRGKLSDEIRLVAVSQEHGRVSRALPTGTRLRVLPNHSCLTVAQFDEMAIVDEERVVDRWKIWRGR